MFVWIFGGVLFFDKSFADFPRPDSIEPVPQDTLFIFSLTSALYNISHSLIVFCIVFFAVYLIFKRPVWELGAWLLHILIDIPTHSYKFFPTPFLWPVSNWKYDGFSWGNPTFLISNYLSILAVYVLLYLLERRRLKGEDK
ncbi:hypothetical protein HY249_02705 [Candidatus Azambacteria bacterium]|nr:hypothetical protein [Candidatus Azambacteria bacterium]